MRSSPLRLDRALSTGRFARPALRRRRGYCGLSPAGCGSGPSWSKTWPGIAAIDPATAGRASHEAIRLCHLGRLANLRFDRPAENVVAFYNKRGTCEQWIKQGKGAIKWTRLSCRSFAANAVRLQLHALAYNLGNFLRTLATPEPIKDWSLTSLKEKLIKIGAKLVSHGRYVAFQMAEVTITRMLFAEILRLIAELRPPPDPASG